MTNALQHALTSAAKTGHSLFSPSGAPKYMLCSGAVYMEREYEDSGSDAAKLGSDKHELSEICLTKGTDPSNYEGRIMGYENEVDEKFIEEVRYYVETVKRIANGSVFAAYEMRVDLSEAKGVPGEGGTSDTVVLKTPKHLFVVDAKFGWIKVPAEDNFQLLEYALGAYKELEKFGLTDEIEKVTLVIVQPQHDIIDDWVITVDELLAHESVMREAVQTALIPFKTGKPVLTPGPKQCRWCKAFADCPAATEVVFEHTSTKKLSIDDFDDLSSEEIGKDVALATKRAMSYKPERLAKAYEVVEFVEAWAREVCKKMYERLDAGHNIPGWKLVAGKKGNRAFSDAEQAEEIMRGARIKVDDMFSKKLITPTAAEKLLKTDKPKVWSKLSEIVVQPEGKPAIAPESSSKPALKTTADEFDDLSEDDEDLC